jgi:hypothetical protein
MCTALACRANDVFAGYLCVALKMISIAGLKRSGTSDAGGISLYILGCYVVPCRYRGVMFYSYTFELCCRSTMITFT